MLFDNFIHGTEDLFQKFDNIHNYIYANDGLSPQQTLEEVIKVIFIKILSESNSDIEFSISNEEYDKIGNGDKSSAIISKINHSFRRVVEIYSDVFSVDDKINLSEDSLAYTVNKLQNISLSNTSDDVKGLAFQKFLTRHEKEGRGQFFTPENVIKFCVNFIQPKPSDTILDPACGSGGFLFSILRYISENNKKTDIPHIIENNLYGLDINKSIARIAKMRLLLYSNNKTNIYATNTLNDLDDLYLKISENNGEFVKNGFDVILTNPPFGTAGKISSKSVLKTYQLGHKWNRINNELVKSETVLNGQVTEILFIERCIDLLKDNGKMGIVLPNGIFENSSLEYVRTYLKSKASIIGIVNLPQETFIPYGTGVKTSLLFLQKTKDSKKRAFISQIQRIGYLGNKNGTILYKKDKNGDYKYNSNNTKIVDEDMTEVLTDYEKFDKNNFSDNERSFTLDQKELTKRFDYNYHSPKYKSITSILNSNNSVPLKDLATIVKSKSKKLKNSTEAVDYIELSDINIHSYEISKSTKYLVHQLPSRASYDVKENDLLTAVAGNSIGTNKHSTALASNKYTGCICTNGFRIIRNPTIDLYYLLYFLTTKLFRKQIYRYRTGAAIPNISDEDFQNILVYIPDLDTIKRISDSMREYINLKIQAQNKLENLQLQNLINLN